MEFTEAFDAQVIENTKTKLVSMSSKRKDYTQASPWPPPAKQLNNKYFVNQLQINDIDSVNTSNGADHLPTEANKSNKYFMNNISLSADGAPMTNILSATSSPSKSQMRTITTDKPNLFVSAASDTKITKSIQHHHHNHSAKVNGTATQSRTSSTHFEIAQKQLVLSKNVPAEPKPMLNHILDSLSVSNSKHLHHDHRFVDNFISFFLLFDICLFEKFFLHVIHSTHGSWLMEIALCS